MGGKVYTRGNVGIRVNDDISHYSYTLKCLRQGDLLSPILFVDGMLAIIIAMAKDDEWDLVPHLVEGGILILQCADDTIIFLRA
jgi:hypothetical protein